MINRQTQMREFLLSLLKQGQAGVTAWNETPVSERATASFEDCDFSNLQLVGISLQKLDAKRSKFDGADLHKAQLEGADVSEASFIGANLEKASMKSLQAVGANFTRANLDSANLFQAKLKNAIFKDADLSNAEMRKSDLRGVDLTACKNLALTNFHGAIYDECTTLPPNFPDLPLLVWQGSGIDAYKQSLKQAACGHVPTDFRSFIKHLYDTVDNKRLKQALTMLKKERFQLFCEVADNQVAGVVKSQWDKGYVHACRLTADGQYACCTQNLKPCSGLQDKVQRESSRVFSHADRICKHILVLVMGLTKAERLTPADAASWIISSTFETPLLDMNEMSEVFLKYMAAEASEIDWRPTETIPEDYYSF